MYQVLIFDLLVYRVKLLEFEMQGVSVVAATGVVVTSGVAVVVEDTFAELEFSPHPVKYKKAIRILPGNSSLLIIVFGIFRRF